MLTDLLCYHAVIDWSLPVQGAMWAPGSSQNQILKETSWYFIAFFFFWKVALSCSLFRKKKSHARTSHFFKKVMPCVLLCHPSAAHGSVLTRSPRDHGLISATTNLLQLQLGFCSSWLLDLCHNPHCSVGKRARRNWPGQKEPTRMCFGSSAAFLRQLLFNNCSCVRQWFWLFETTWLTSIGTEIWNWLLLLGTQQQWNLCCTPEEIWMFLRARPELWTSLAGSALR